MRIFDRFLRNLKLVRELDALRAERDAQRARESASHAAAPMVGPVVVHHEQSRIEQVALAGDLAGSLARPEFTLPDLLVFTGAIMGRRGIVPQNADEAELALRACVDRRNERFPDIPILALHR